MFTMNTIRPLNRRTYKPVHPLGHPPLLVLPHNCTYQYTCNLRRIFENTIQNVRISYTTSRSSVVLRRPLPSPVRWISSTSSSASSILHSLPWPYADPIWQKLFLVSSTNISSINTRHTWTQSVGPTTKTHHQQTFLPYVSKIHSTSASSWMALPPTLHNNPSSTTPYTLTSTHVFFKPLPPASKLASSSLALGTTI